MATLVAVRMINFCVLKGKLEGLFAKIHREFKFKSTADDF